MTFTEHRFPLALATDLLTRAPGEFPPSNAAPPAVVAAQHGVIDPETVAAAVIAGGLSKAARNLGPYPGHTYGPIQTINPHWREYELVSDDDDNVTAFRGTACFVLPAHHVDSDTETAGGKIRTVKSAEPLMQVFYGPALALSNVEMIVSNYLTYCGVYDLVSETHHPSRRAGAYRHQSLTLAEWSRTLAMLEKGVPFNVVMETL